MAQSSFLMKWWLSHHFSWNDGSVIISHEKVAQLSFRNGGSDIIFHEMVAQSSCLIKWWLSFHFSEYNHSSAARSTANGVFLQLKSYLSLSIHKFFLNLGGYVPALPILIRKATHFINQSLFSPHHTPYYAPSLHYFTILNGSDNHRNDYDPLIFIWRG